MVKNNTFLYSAITTKFQPKDSENLLCVAKKEDVAQTSLTKEGVKFRLRNHKKSIPLKNAARG